jgi:hypothetical protein
MEGKSIRRLATLALGLGLAAPAQAGHGHRVLIGRDLGPTQHHPCFPPPPSTYRLPLFSGLRSYLPLCPGPTWSQYAPNRQPHIPPSYHFLPPCTYYDYLIDPLAPARRSPPSAETKGEGGAPYKVPMGSEPSPDPKGVSPQVP